MKNIHIALNKLFLQTFILFCLFYSNISAQENSNPEFRLDFKYTSSWYNGFVGVVTASNIGDKAIEDWEVSFKGNFGIDEEWNAVIDEIDTLNGGYRYNFKADHWNKKIYPGQSISFGLTAAFNNETLPVPHDFKLNGFSAERGLVQSFFADWSNYMGVNPKDLPLEKLDRIVHAFAIINDSGEVTHQDRYSDIEMLFEGDTPDQPVKGNFNQYRLIKEDHPKMKITYSIIARGHNRVDYKKAAATEDNREKFVFSAINFMQTYGFDGINIDWEFPEVDDNENLIELLKLLRSELDKVGFLDNKHYELSFASPAPYLFLKDINLAAIANYVDQVSIMGFNYFGPWEKNCGHNSPLYHNISDELPFPDEIKEYLKTVNVDWTVKYHLQNGVPAQKITLGLPLYSQQWTNVTDIFGNGGLYSEGIGAVQLPYNQVLSLYNDSGYTRYWDDLSKTAYLYSANKKGGHFVTFDDTLSSRIKAEYVNEHHIKGISFWMGAYDGKGSESLINKVSETLFKVEGTAVKMKSEK